MVNSEDTVHPMSLEKLLNLVSCVIPRIILLDRAF